MSCNWYRSQSLINLPFSLITCLSRDRWVSFWRIESKKKLSLPDDNFKDPFRTVRDLIQNASLITKKSSFSFMFKILLTVSLNPSGYLGFFMDNSEYSNFRCRVLELSILASSSQSLIFNKGLHRYLV